MAVKDEDKEDWEDASFFCIRREWLEQFPLKVHVAKFSPWKISDIWICFSKNSTRKAGFPLRIHMNEIFSNENNEKLLWNLQSHRKNSPAGFEFAQLSVYVVSAHSSPNGIIHDYIEISSQLYQFFSNCKIDNHQISFCSSCRHISTLVQIFCKPTR